MKISILIFGLLSGFTAASIIMEKRQNACSPVHIIVARGSGEPQGEGATGRLATTLKEEIPGTTSEAVDYPAKLSPYPQSESAGVKACKEQMTAYVKKCRESKIVLMGYSQGADVVGSALCGGALGTEGSRPISADVGRNVVAAVLFGDPRWRMGMAYNKGTATKDGMFPRAKTYTCAPYVSRMISFCDSGDTFCDKGNSTAVHGSYLRKYSTEAAGFVEAQVKKLKVPVS